jgi:hypothetical protein
VVVSDIKSLFPFDVEYLVSRLTISLGYLAFLSKEDKDKKIDYFLYGLLFKKLMEKQKEAQAMYLYLLGVYGSDGVGSLSGRSCIVWSGSLNRPALIRYLLKNAIDLTVSNPFAV